MMLLEERNQEKVAKSISKMEEGGGDEKG